MAMWVCVLVGRRFSGVWVLRQRGANALDGQKKVRLGGPHVMAGTMQKNWGWNCGYEPSPRRTNTPSGFVIRRGHCTASFRSSRLLPSPLISTVDYRNEAIRGRL